MTAPNAPKWPPRMFVLDDADVIFGDGRHRHLAYSWNAEHLAPGGMKEYLSLAEHEAILREKEAEIDRWKKIAEGYDKTFRIISGQ